MLLQELLLDGNMLFGANAPTYTTKAKLVTLRKIAEKISALRVVQRTGNEVKLEWKGLRKDVTEKDAVVKVTGGDKVRENMSLLSDCPACCRLMDSSEFGAHILN